MGWTAGTVVRATKATDIPAREKNDANKGKWNVDSDDEAVHGSWVVRFDDGDQMNCMLQSRHYGARGKWVFVEDREAMRELQADLKV